MKSGGEPAPSAFHPAFLRMRTLAQVYKVPEGDVDAFLARADEHRRLVEALARVCPTDHGYDPSADICAFCQLGTRYDDRRDIADAAQHEATCLWRRAVEATR